MSRNKCWVENINTHPTKCNLCGGEVVYMSNANIYGRQYGSGFCYYCTSCHAFVGTHKPRPDEAMGLLADSEMRDLKVKCHEFFDKFWKTREERSEAYSRLAEAMRIPIKLCHFGFFNKKNLNKAIEILQTW